MKVIPTALRKNEYYYKIYYVYLNSIFASILPLALLLFLNISTAIELIKMSRQESLNLLCNTSMAILPLRTMTPDYIEKGISLPKSSEVVTDPVERQTRLFIFVVTQVHFFLRLSFTFEFVPLLLSVIYFSLSIN